MLYRLSRRSVLGGFVLLVFLLSGSITWIAESSSKKPPITFLWSSAAITGAPDDRKLIELTSDSILYSGDKFKMMFEATERCYVYIVFKGSDDKILMLHPEKFKSNSHPPKENKTVFIPSEHGWFTLDTKPGTETLYVIVSFDPLSNLEALLEQYYAASLARRDEIGQSIVKLIHETESFSQPLVAKAEKPIQIGGTMRGLTDSSFPEADITRFTKEIAIEELFIRTYSIEHR